ncbi:MAG: glycoside hydrolase family 3 N-terminal domain-containing protein, partial [Spirochaetales bacterium]
MRVQTFLGAVLLVLQGLSGIGCVTAGKYVPYSSRQGNPEQLKAQVLGLISTLSLEEKIAQRCILYIPKDLNLEEIEEYVRLRKPGGIILYRWNYVSLEELKHLTQTIQRAYPAGYPRPFICADQEGGRVQAFRFREFAQMPPAYHLGLYRDAELIRAAAYITAVQMREAGCSMNLAPVLDVVEAGDTSIIGDRSYGTDPDWVAEAARAYLRGMHQGGIIPVVKHFPGHGSTRIDSHSR